MRIFLITDSEHRHRFIAHEFSTFCNDLMVIHEKKEVKNNNISHFSTRARFEREILTFDSGRYYYNELTVPKGRINSDPSLTEKIIEFCPDFVIFYGCCLIEHNVIEKLNVPLINIHLGLSPYYRGSGTNFWPFFNQEPEFVGVTFHSLTAKVDGGDILLQLRADSPSALNIHEYGLDLIKRIPEEMSFLLKSFDGQQVAQSSGAFAERPRRLYKQAEFNDEVSKWVDSNFVEVLASYLKNKGVRDASAPIIDRSFRIGL